MTPGGSVESRQGLSRRAESVSSPGFVFPNDTNHHGTMFDRRVLSGVRRSVCVDVFAEHQPTSERTRATGDDLTMVALDAAGNPTPVPRLIVETEEERADDEQAGHVREAAIRRSDERWAMGDEAERDIRSLLILLAHR